MGMAIGYEYGHMRSSILYCSSYGAFSRWRESLAAAAGYQVAMVCFKSPPDYYEATSDPHFVPLLHPTILIDWGCITEANLRGQWDEMPDDPLLLIIAHHDHRGALPPEFLEPLADRIEELLPKLSNDWWGHPPPNSIHEYTGMFVLGLRAAARAGAPLWFG